MWRGNENVLRFIPISTVIQILVRTHARVTLCKMNEDSSKQTEQCCSVYVRCTLLEIAWCILWGTVAYTDEITTRN